MINNMKSGGSGEQMVAATQHHKEKEYWLNKLSGELVKSYFPYDRRETSGNRNLRIEKFKLSGETVSKLNKLSKEVDYTLHMILLAGVAVLLDKYTHMYIGPNTYRRRDEGFGHRDITLGAPIYKQEIEGDFVNTILVLRNWLNDRMTFKELLIQVKQTIAEAVKNQNYPIETLLYHLNIPVVAGDFPLFDIAVLLENIHEQKYLAQITLNMIFSFLRTGNDVEGCVQYNEQRYTSETIQRIISHFSFLLLNLMDHLDSPIPGIEMISSAEKQQLLAIFNGGYREYPHDKTIQQLFAEQAERTPDRVGLLGPGEINLTYRHLHIKSNQLACFLQEKGMRPGHIAGLMMQNSAEMIIAILGILKTGGAYLPINPEYPLERISTILADSSVSILLAPGIILEELPFNRLRSFEKGQSIPLVTSPREQVKDLDSLQMPDRSLIDYEKYRPYIGQAMVKNNIMLQFSRGCVYNCAYCFKIWRTGYANRSAENIFQEIQMYYNMGVRRFGFVDDLPNFNVKESAKLFQLIIKNGLHVHLHFPNGIRGDILTHDYIDLMVEAGAVTMDLALETSSPRLQKLIRKNLHIDRLRENIQYIIEKYPHVILETQLIHGLPSETETEALASLEFLKNFHWLHFPYIHILKIYPNTEMAAIAVENGISKEAIDRSAELGYNDIPETIPFPANFTRQYQAEFLDKYFLDKQRLLSVLPWQMKSLTKDELVQKYNSYLPAKIATFSDLLNYAGISREEIKSDFLPADYGCTSDLNEKIKTHFPHPVPQKEALRVLLLDLSQYFTAAKTKMVYDVVEPPLGLIYLLTHLQRTFGAKVCGKIAKSRIDFDDYRQLKELVEEFQPDVIGIRTLNFYKDFFHRAISLIRQWGVKGPIIAGGPYATSSYSVMLKDTHIDLAVLGEGEITFSEIIRCIMENGGKLPGDDVLSNIEGIAFMKESQRKALRPYNQEILAFEVPRYAQQDIELNPAVNAKSSYPAYVIYTSGSTGIPKGVMVEHRSLVNQVTGLIRRFNLADADTPVSPLHYAMVAPFTFDVSLMHIFLALFTGGKLFVMDEKTKKDAAVFWKFIGSSQIDILNITPAFMKVLLAHMDKIGNRFKYLFVGGDDFPPGLYAELKKAFAVESIFNIYGPTETTINATLYPCAEGHKGAIPIGRPLTNYQVYIVDRFLNPLPIGVPGEICIAGEGVARGYLNRPELTAEKFRPQITQIAQITQMKNKNNALRADFQHSAFSIQHSNLYCTGDLGRWLPDGPPAGGGSGGVIEFMGRIDHQVKIRGFRVELEEIENQLLKKESIKEAIVLAREDKDGSKNLYAYIIPDKTAVNPNREPADLRNYLSRRLPDFMIPSYFIPIEKIPLTLNGTIDIKALPGPVLKAGNEYMAPRDEIEEQLVKLWAEVLELDKTQIGIDTNFFELGGHSLRATILIAKIHKAFQTKIPLLELFKTPRIRGMAEYIRNTVKERHISIEPVEEKEYYECSSAQKRLYIESLVQTGSMAYNMTIIMELAGHLDYAKLENVFLHLIRRHENLRTSFDVIEDHAIQRIHRLEDISFSLERVAKTIEDFIKPFDLSHAPVFRVGLIKEEEKRHILMVDMHHIISDGISLKTLGREFMALYSGDELPSLRIQYKDFSEWQNRLFRSQEIEKQKEYWLKVFAGGIPVLNLPTDYHRQSIRNYEGKTIDFEIDSRLATAVKNMAAETGSTLHIVLMTVFTILMSKYGGQEDIVVGSGVSGRRHADLENVIGMFVNLIPMRNYPKKDLSFLEFLEKVKTNALNAYENQDYPFDALVKDLNLQGKPGANPLFDVVFQTQNVDIPGLKVGDLTVKPIKWERNVSHFDLILTAFENPETIITTINYSSKIYKTSTAEEIGKNFLEILRQAVENRDIRIQDIGITIQLVEASTSVLKEIKENIVDFDFQ